MTPLTIVSVKYIETSFREGYLKIKELIKDHWKEVGMKGGPTTMAPDLHYMFRLDDTNSAFATFAIDSETEEVLGYYVGARYYHPHHLGVLFANTFFCYVKPSARGVVGVKLLKFTEKLLKEKYSVKYFQFGVNSNNAKVGGMLERMNYSLSDYIYVREL